MSEAVPAETAGSGAGELEVRRIGGVILALIAVGFLALLLAGFFAVRTLAQSESRYELVQHTLQVQVTITRLGNQVERSEAARRGYMLARDPLFRETVQSSVAEMDRTADELARLVVDNPEQVERTQRLRDQIGALQALQRDAIGLIDSGRADEARAAFGHDRSAPLLRDIRTLRQQMTDAEDRLLAQRDLSRSEAIAQFYTILTVCAFLVLAIVGAAVLVIRRYTNALATSQRELQKLNAHLEDAVRERTNELQRANEEIQRFAYIVSHDLRSPLVNVMGFTSELESARLPLVALVEAADRQAPDLVTREARMAVEEDLPEAVRFIRTSTEKMDRLINAILRLSREGRRNLAPERLAMSELVAKAADALRHRTDELGAKIEIAALPDLVGDRTAIEQIFSNLLENAVKYLKPGRAGAIRVAGHGEGDRRVYEIADNGRGIDPRDHQRIFDLFRRSGAQDQPGEGIGLAHVRSLVWRLGGSIEVESRLDEGATFRLVLPSGTTGEVRHNGGKPRSYDRDDRG
jgi:signal transduction histidine kinase